MNLLQNWQKSFPEDHKFMHYQLKQKGEIMHLLADYLVYDSSHHRQNDLNAFRLSVDLK